MSEQTQLMSPAEVAEAHGVNADSCLKASWAITELLDDTLGQLQQFQELFAKFAKDKALGPIFHDAAGVAWAIEQFCGLQRGQLPYWASTGVRVAPETEEQP